MYQINGAVKVLAQLVPQPGSKYLELSETFSHVWQNTMQDIASDDALYFLMRPNAGFTDSRIVFLWIKGQAIFAKNPYFVAQIGVDDWDSENSESIQTLLSKILTQNNQSLDYAKEPNIGTK